jgi:hypothetical protein
VTLSSSGSFPKRHDQWELRMKKRLLGAVGVASLILAGSPAAAANLIEAQITGPTGTVWDTDAGNSFYGLFLQQPTLGSFINPGEELNDPITIGANNYLLAGEGFRPGEVADSDPIYNLLLRFADGATLTGTYTPVGNIFVAGSSAIVGGTAYTLNQFSFRRTLGDSVSAFAPTPGGDTNDYAGSISFSAAAVPEPGTWAMMLLGFGAVGYSMRRRRTTHRLAQAV